MATLKALKLSLCSRNPSVLSPVSLPEGAKQEGTDFGEMPPTAGSNARENQNDSTLPMVHTYTYISAWIPAVRYLLAKLAASCFSVRY